MLAALVAVTFASACGDAGRDPAGSPRVILVGADGLDWSVALPLVADGRMPELARLMEHGTYGKLETQSPTISPIIWTSIATGKTADKHGIHGFHVDTGRTELSTNQDRQTKAFWNVLTDYDRRVHVVGWWLTHPVEEINGVMVSQTNLLRGTRVETGLAPRKGSLLENTPRQVHPPAREREIFGLLRESVAAFPEHLDRVFGEARPPRGALTRMWNTSLWSLRADAVYSAIGARLAEEKEFDLLAVYLGGTDVLGHRFWRYYEPGRYAHPPSAAEVERLGSIIPDYYAFLDRVMGRLRRAAGETPTILLVSDHGMHASRTDQAFRPRSRPADLISGGHKDAPAGIFAAAGPGIRNMDGGPAAGVSAADLVPVGAVLDIAPTLYALLDVPLADDLAGAPLEGVLEPWLLERQMAPQVSSHDDPAWLAARRTSDRVKRDESDRIQQLRELGYVE